MTPFTEPVVLHLLTQRKGERERERKGERERERERKGERERSWKIGGITQGPSCWGVMGCPQPLEVQGDPSTTSTGVLDLFGRENT